MARYPEGRGERLIAASGADASQADWPVEGEGEGGCGGRGKTSLPPFFLLCAQLTDPVLDILALAGEEVVHHVDDVALLRRQE